MKNTYNELADEFDKSFRVIEAIVRLQFIDRDPQFSEDLLGPLRKARAVVEGKVETEATSE